MKTSTTIRRLRFFGLAAAITAAAVISTGCNDAQSGALLGAGVGALAGQAIGGNTSATLIGTGIGAGAGYIIGNESDKEKARQRDARYEY